MNNKGGVGKTTVSCNLAVALTRFKKRVLVIDMDSQCNTSGILLPRNTSIKQSLYELLDPGEKTPVPIEDCIYTSKHEGLYCLPNVEETSGLEMDLISIYPKSLQMLRDKIKGYVLNNFDFTIIDNPPNMGIFVVNSLYASEFVIVPNDVGSAYSLDGLRKALDLINSVRESGNPNLRFLRLLINRVDLRTAISKVIISDIQNRFNNDQFFKTMVPVNTCLQQAEYLKETVSRRYPTSRATKAFRELAKELLTILKPVPILSKE
jgi:chromosome partitioning protein